MLIQIWTAMIAYLLFILLKLRSTGGWCLVTQPVNANHVDESPSLWEILCPREKKPLPQLCLFNVGDSC